MQRFDHAAVHPTAPRQRCAQPALCAGARTDLRDLRTLGIGKNAIKTEHPMLETIAILLIILWALGMLTSYTMGGFVHILLVIAIVVVLIRVINGRKPF
jgi:hypothetical protein